VRKIKTALFAAIAAAVMTTSTMTAPAAEAAVDQTPPVLDSISLVEPGPFEFGDVVKVAFTAHDEGGNGVTALRIYLIDAVGESRLSEFTFAPGQATVSETVEIPITSEWGTGTVVSTHVHVLDGSFKSTTSTEELGFGIGGLAEWSTTHNPYILSAQGAEVSYADIGSRLSVRAAHPTWGLQWAPTPSFTWQWLRDGVPIDGATGDTYEAQLADGGTSISVQSATTRPGYRVSTHYSNPVTITSGPPLTVGSAAIEGDTAVSATLTAVTNGWSPEPSTYQYDWYRNGALITSYRNAPAGSYVVQDADVGATITVRVSGSVPGYSGGWVDSPGVYVPNPTSSPTPSPKPLGTGAVSIKGPSSELLPGVTVEIRKNNCSGQAVWRTTTTDRPDAYGAFGIGLEQGSYCIKTLSVPHPYSIPADVTFNMESRPANWVTVWVPGPVMVTGALVAKDSNGTPINGVTAYLREGSCNQQGRGVWQNTTAANRWAEGGFGVTLAAGVHCVSTLSVPSGYQTPAPYQINVTAPSPYWITTWVSGTGPSTQPPAPYYANCAAVRDAGVAPIYRGQPGYGAHLDRDGDGVACEP
jgi:hypothetical protein